MDSNLDELIYCCMHCWLEIYKQNSRLNCAEDSLKLTSSAYTQMVKDCGVEDITVNPVNRENMYYGKPSPSPQT